MRPKASWWTSLTALFALRARVNFSLWREMALVIAEPMTLARGGCSCCRGSVGVDLRDARLRCLPCGRGWIGF